MRRTAATILCVLAVVTTCEAQMVQTNRKEVKAKTNPAERIRVLREAPVETGEQSTQDKSTQVDALSQANVSIGNTGPNVTVHALKLYLHPSLDWPRFYLSTMLPTQTNQGSTTSTAASGGTQNSQKPSPSDYLKASLLDEYGGLVNASLGLYKPLVPYIDDQHGLILDIRSGIKLLEVPELQTGGSNTSSNSFSKSVSPFLNFLATASWQFPLYQDDKDPKSGRMMAGGLTFGASFMNTYATDTDFQTLFQTQLNRDITNVNFSVAINLTSVMYIQVNGTAYTNEGALGKRLVASFNAIRQ